MSFARFIPTATCMLAVVIGGCAKSGSVIATSPGERGQLRGLELVTMVVDDQDAVVGATLAAALDRPVPIPDAQRTRLRSAGFRIVALPASDLEPWRESVRRAQRDVETNRYRAAGLSEGQIEDLTFRDPFVDPLDRQWLGEVPSWSELVRGPRVEAGTEVALEDGLMRLAEGQLRILGRCWVVPTERPGEPRGAALRIELAPQLKSRRPGALGIDSRPPAERDGAVFSTLVAEFVGVPGEAYLIVPDSPGAEWRAPDESETAAQATDVDFVGPIPSPVPSLGEAMLQAQGSSGGRRLKAIIALIPKAPARYELLGR